MILSNLESFQALASNSNNKVVQFEFEFIKLVFNCIFIPQSKVLIISNNDRRVAFAINIKADNSFNTKIPTDFYDAIKDYLLEEIDSYKITPFYEKLNEVLPNAELSEISDMDVLKLVSYTFHTDKAKDECAGAPYFNGWNLNKGKNKKPSNLNLDKTERYFGFEVRELCQKNKVTSQWSATATDKSLDILKLNEVIAEISQ